jgi:hypothetical protein
LLLNLSFRRPALVLLVTAGMPSPACAHAATAAYTTAGCHIGNVQDVFVRWVEAHTNTSQYRVPAHTISLDCTWYGGRDPAEEAENSEKRQPAHRQQATKRGNQKAAFG